MALALAAGFLAHAALFRAYVNDDAYITFRYARNWAAGRGPYFNPGERVEGYSNFLLTALLTPVIGFAGPAAAAPAARAIGLASGVACVLLAFALARRLARSDPQLASVGKPAGGANVVGLTAAGIVAAAPAFAVNALSGLETTLFAALLIAGVYLGQLSIARGRWRGAGFAWAAAVLTRPEGIALAGVYWIAAACLAPPGLPRLARELWRNRWEALARQPIAARHLLPDGLIVAATFVGHLAFRRFVYGEWVPNTYHAKAGGFWTDAWQYVGDGALLPVCGAAGALLAAAGWVLFGGGPGETRVFGGARRDAWIVAAVGTAGALLPLVTGTDWMVGWRLVMPALPLLAVMAALGWGRLALRRWPTAGTVLLLAFVPAAWFWQAGTRAELREHVTIRSRGYAGGHAAAAEWLAARARPGDAIALMDIGLIGYRCIDQRIIDVTGLTDHFIARSPGPFLQKEYDPAYILDQRPRFIVLTLWWPGEASTPPKPPVYSPWTAMEARLLDHPQFQRDYVDQAVQRGADPRSSWPAWVAAQVGAQRGFVHEAPGHAYLLAVFERRD